MAAKKEKYPLEKVKKLSPEFLQTLISKAKKYLKKDAVMKEVFDLYHISIDELDDIPVMFKELDVSARTERGIVYLNYKLLCDGDFFRDYSYLVHEFNHYLQQTSGTKPTQGARQGEYLDNKFELEGFQNQIKWLAENFGANDADDYVDKMLDYHGFEGQEKEEKAEQLTRKVK